jgi:biopolymer transport protein ExbB/TolQ
MDSLLGYRNQYDQSRGGGAGHAEALLATAMGLFAAISLS